MPTNDEHIGSTLDELLAADGTLDEVRKIAEERVRAYQEEQARDGGAAVHALPPQKVAFAR